MLDEVEVLVFDIQDVGARFYTYVSTMLESMKAAARDGIPFLVLDRPVPIDGARVEGPVLEKGYESFVGSFQLPIRYAMTPAELALMMNSQLSLQVKLDVVPLKGLEADPLVRRDRTDLDPTLAQHGHTGNCIDLSWILFD